MPCYHPLSAFQTDAGEIVFSERGAIRRSLTLPCGRCIGCRLRRSRNWAIRCMHELQTSQHGAFLTLTYEDGSVAINDHCNICDKDIFSGSLHYCDFQLFMKRLRNFYFDCTIRFFAVGEYGSQLGRPHFHALVYCNAKDPRERGFLFADRKRMTSELWQSATADSLWKKGKVSIGDVTFQSAGYCARYCCDKVNGPLAEVHYKRVDIDSGHVVDVVPEFAHMSLRPAIGKPWFLKFWREVFLARDGVVVNGKTFPAPGYYTKLLDIVAPDLSDGIEYDRYVKSVQFAADCTPERLFSREIVEKARFKLLKREL